MTTVNEQTTNEEVKNTQEEDVMELVGMGIDMIKRVKKGYLQRGFVMGLLTAVAVQSVVTIFIILSYMN